ncbi:bifunctional tetrahydrofolate synthase/dihydrofolate synthase [uncultured Stenotrophomonas sp.]|uniref:bifunctional tetrahydrofolate synthase/dihydrofolate synthase n=1 Tax=uncultured Stenotrophomonas sp. TaxID=165438 RepID=UPI0028D6C5D9|nr:bifunctional tetrahydrofolate synthase/dihydrofolate synthase [uncultured Stenotrophomonas sp.]
MTSTRPHSLAEWLSYIEQQHPATIDMGLERVRTVATAMGLGQPAPRTIVVGGTNGKGSTVAFIEAIARAAGWKVGAYTSPHLLRYNERVRIDGEDASDAALVAAFNAIEDARGSTTLTYFEYGTLAALQLFAQAGLDLAVLEVGLGGRLDAVNIVDADVAVITTVDIDHADWLGNDREAIGVEKAGIIRGWKPVILGETDPPSSVLARAYLVGANAIRGGSDFFADVIDAQHWRWRDVGFRIELPVPALRGPIQLRNAASAIAALRALDKPLPRAAIVEGVAQARIRGRLQAFERDGVEVLVDVGHNPQAARELATALKATPTAGRTVAVFAALQDKDAAGVVEALAERVDDWHLAGLDGARAQTAAALRSRLSGTAAAAASTHADVDTALQQALAAANAGDRVLVFGSFHTAAQALLWLENAR